MLSLVKRLLSKKKTKPLKLTTAYTYSIPSASQSSLGGALTVEVVQASLSKQPEFKGAEISLYTLPKGTKVLGFDKPRRYEGYVIVYPENVLSSTKWNTLLEQALKRRVQAGELQLSDTSRCLEVRRDDFLFYLVRPEMLRLVGWMGR